MRISEAVEIAHLLGRPADEVMEAAGVAIRNMGSSIQITGTIDGSGEFHYLPLDQRTSIPHPGGDLPVKVSAVRCETAGTPIDYMDGWLLMMTCGVGSGTVPAEAVGRMSVCQIAGGIRYLAKPVRGDRRGRWNLIGPAATARDVELDWATPVLSIQT